MTDAVKMALESLKRTEWSQHTEGFNKGIDAAIQALTALEQAGEPVDVALLDRAELAWQRFFYPAADCFTGPIGDKLPAFDLEVADCLRLVLAAVGRLVITPEADVQAPLPTPQRLGKEFDGEGRALIANLAAVVRIQNGNRHDDINGLLASADEFLSTPTPAQVEPVAVIGKDWALHWASADSLKDIVDRTGIKIGSPLYASPPARLGQEGDKGEAVSGSYIRTVTPLLLEPKFKSSYQHLKPDEAHKADHYLVETREVFAALATSQKGDE